MNFAVKPPASARSRRGLAIFLTGTPPTASLKHLFRPLFPPQPPFPPLRSGPRAASRPSRQKQIPSSHNSTYEESYIHQTFSKETPRRASYPVPNGGVTVTSSVTGTKTITGSVAFWKTVTIGGSGSTANSQGLSFNVERYPNHESKVEVFAERTASKKYRRYVGPGTSPGGPFSPTGNTTFGYTNVILGVPMYREQ